MRPDASVGACRHGVLDYSGARLRIGVDARLMAYRQAGIARYTKSLLEALVRGHPEHEFTIFVARNGRRVVGPQPHVRHRTLLTPPHHRLENLTLRIELAGTRLDVYHSPDFVAPRLKAGIATVVTVHDLYFLYDPTVLDRPSVRYYGQARRRLKHVDAIIAVSEQTRQDLARFADAQPERVSVVHEAAAETYRQMTRDERLAALTRLTKPLSPAASRVLLGEAGAYILFVGTIEPRKNLLMLFAAYRDYRRRAGNNAAKLVLAGAAGWRDEGEFAEIARLGASGELIWLGQVPDELLLLLYNGAAALVLPSRYEGFGLTALEALACGVPVLASAVASLPEVVGDAGVLLPPDDPAAWTAAMLDAIGNPLLRQRLRDAGPRQAKRFSWTRAAAETIAVYRSAVERHANRIAVAGASR